MATYQLTADIVVEATDTPDAEDILDEALQAMAPIISWQVRRTVRLKDLSLREQSDPDPVRERD